MNIPERSLIPPEPVTVHYCSVCGDEITPGYTAIRLPDGEWFCRRECLLRYIDENFTTAEIAQMIMAEEQDVERQ